MTLKISCSTGIDCWLSAALRSDPELLPPACFSRENSMSKLFAATLALLCASPLLASETPHPFNAHDLVNMQRISDPQLSRDGTQVVYTLRQTDYAANKGLTSLWLLDLATKDAKPFRLTDPQKRANSPRWSADGASIYYLGKSGDSSQLWRQDVAGAAASSVKDGKVLGIKYHAVFDHLSDAVQVSKLPLDVSNFVLAPDGKHVAFSADVFTDCADIACSKKRHDERAANKASGRHYDKLFVRHWDAWADGTRAQVFVAELGKDGIDGGKLAWVTRGIDGDVPSKPFGGDDEYSFSPDSKTVYFDARIAGRTEPWSTNFDVYSVPADASAPPKNLTAENLAWDATPVASHDGKTLYYLAMKKPTFEADRFGIMALDLASGKSREIDAEWDRSAGGIKLSKDGKTLYTTSDDNGDHSLFAVDIASGKARKIVTTGQVEGFDIAGDSIVYTRSTLKNPADLFRTTSAGDKPTQLTHVNAEALANIQFGDYEFFDFKGWNNETVQGYVVKPVGYKAGQKYPIAFIIHGGPQGAMTNDFHYRWNAQTYAGQGYAVVTINFHGSTGYGQAFTDSISGDWGGKPLEDLQKGYAAALEKYTFLDGDHACALGASYGGYMVYWIAGNWQKPWKCLIDHDGVFDSRMMSYATEELWFDEWEHHGTQFDKPEAYERFNPVNYVAKWSVPMLVIHSEKDFRIPEEQGLAAFTALQRRGIPSEFLTFPDENHWVLKPQNSVQWHDTVNAWLKKWLVDTK